MSLECSLQMGVNCFSGIIRSPAVIVLEICHHSVSPKEG